MLSTQLPFYLKTTKFVANIGKRNFNNVILKSNHFSYLVNSQTLSVKSQNSHIFDTECNRCNSKPKISSNSVQYSTKPIEIPLPPSPPPEADVFGTIGGSKYENVELSADELKEEERLKTLGGRVPRKLKPSPGQYADMMKNYIVKGDMEMAENIIVECRKNHDKPTPYMYTLLIRAFAMQGDVKNSYKYYSEMKVGKHKIKANVYTSLFNACANSPDTEKALRYLEKVREYMTKEKQPLNHAHYNVLVKAYGCHNKYEEAMKLFQEMINNKLKIGISTLNSLMFAANSNKESGLKDVLYIWQLMRKLKIPPDLFTYNLLLKAIRDTNFGNHSVDQLLLSNDTQTIVIDDNRPDLLSYPPVISSLPLKNIHKTNLLNPPKLESDSFDSSKSIETNDSVSSSDASKDLPASIANLHLDAILKQNKLILFGGVDGLLEKMKNDRIEPNVKTVTYLIELVPNSIIVENEMIKYAKSNKIRLDIDFFNMLIKKRCLRGDKKEAKAVLDEIHKADLKPNIVTYGVLALSCSTANESRNLLNAMKATGHTINKYVANTLLESAFYERNFMFILELMELIKRERVRVDEVTFEKLDTFKQKMTSYVKTKHRCAQSDKFKVGFTKFKLRYKTWQEDMGRKVMTERTSKTE